MRVCRTIWVLGVVVTTLIASGATVAEVYTYDSIGRLTSVTYSDASVDVYSYDSRGNVVAVQSQMANLGVVRGADPDPVDLGSLITYSLSITNVGPHDLTTTTATIDLPVGASLESAVPSVGSCSGSGPVVCALGPMLNGANETISVSLLSLSAGAQIGGVSVVGDIPDVYIQDNFLALLNTINDTDLDADGVSSAIELSAPNGGDGNGDGILDYSQADVTSLPSTVTADYVTIEVSGACSTIQNVTSLQESDLSDDPSYEYTHGLVGFNLPCAAADLKIYYHNTPSLASSSYRKYGASTPGNPGTTEWYDFSTVVFGVSIIDSMAVATASFSLADGQLGDDTGVDGSIVDPGGPATAPPMVEAPWDAFDQSIVTDGGGNLDYTLPFVFPFAGRSIESLSINQHGLVELLENGEVCSECAATTTHFSGNHITQNIDAIFALNDDLAAAVVVSGDSNRVVIEWLGTTSADSDFTINPVLFSMTLHTDGRVVWRLTELQWSSYSGDLFTGIYDEVEDTQLEIPGGSTTAISQSAFEYDPSGPTLLAIPWSTDGSLATTDDGNSSYVMPFTFPWHGRSIDALDVNSNGLLELLESAESCSICGDYGTHYNGDHIGSVDSIFALNDDLISGVQIHGDAERVTLTWIGTTFFDDDFSFNPLVHQTILFPNGNIEWKFYHADWSDYDYDLFTGIYDAVGDLESEISTPSDSFSGQGVDRRFQYNAIPEPGLVPSLVSGAILLMALHRLRQRGGG